MNIKKSLLASVLAFCVVASHPGVLLASSAPQVDPTPSVDSGATTTTSTTTIPRTTTTRIFVWSNRTVTAGSKLKLSNVVSVKAKGTRAYRASGACSVRKGVLSFKRVGKCRVSVSVTATGTTKIMRSSKLFTVRAKQFSVPQMKLTGTPEEQTDQVVVAAEKVAAISDFKKWSVALHQLNLSLVSYGVKVVWDPNDVGRNIYQISMDGQRACFLWETVPGTLDKYLKLHSCAK